jgi:hypothetical protein
MSPGLRAAEARRCSLKSLLVNVRCGGVLDLLPGHDVGNPGEHSPRLGTAWAVFRNTVGVEEG